MNLKNYNVFSAVGEYRLTVVLILVSSGVVFWLTNKKDYVLIYAVIVQIVFMVALTLRNLANYSKVRNYIKQNEREINDKYQINTGFGYVSFFRNFNETEIKKLLGSPIKNEFSKCYIFPIKLMMSFLITISIFVVVSMLPHPN